MRVCTFDLHRDDDSVLYSTREQSSSCMQCRPIHLLMRTIVHAPHARRSRCRSLDWARGRTLAMTRATPRAGRAPTSRTTPSEIGSALGAGGSTRPCAMEPRSRCAQARTHGEAYRRSYLLLTQLHVAMSSSHGAKGGNDSSTQRKPCCATRSCGQWLCESARAWDGLQCCSWCARCACVCSALLTCVCVCFLRRACVDSYSHAHTS